MTGTEATSRRRLRVGVVFGGRSGEHEVSLMSARSVIHALNPERYEIIPIGISPRGDWLIGENPLHVFERSEKADGTAEQRATLLPDPTVTGLLNLDQSRFTDPLDVVFPVLHGTYGEDGCIQGLFELAGIPYVGSGVAASSVGMDKALMKAVFAQAGLPQVPYFVATRRQFHADFAALKQRVMTELGFPCFVKPANSGSSVGISKVKTQEELRDACELAARFDRKLIFEAAADGREIEVSVLGNYEPKASLPGEIIPANEFYDYRAKYHDDRSQLRIPAPLSPTVTEQVRDMAIRAFQAIDGAGLGRVDFFVAHDESAIYVNEINTMPGFTQISMYPKLWEASGLSYGELLDQLIALAFERQAENETTERSYSQDF